MNLSKRELIKPAATERNEEGKKEKGRLNEMNEGRMERWKL